MYSACLGTRAIHMHHDLSWLRSMESAVRKRMMVRYGTDILRGRLRWRLYFHGHLIKLYVINQNAAEIRTPSSLAESVIDSGSGRR